MSGAGNLYYAGYYLSDAVSITKLYRVSLFSMRSYASLICCAGITSTPGTIVCSAQCDPRGVDQSSNKI